MSKARGKSTTKNRDRAAKDKTDAEAIRKSTALAYVVLSSKDSEELLEMTAIEMECKLQEVFQLKPDTDLKEASILDYYVGATHWAKEKGFNGQQLSGFFTVVHTLLHKLKDEGLSWIDSFKEYRKMLIGIGTELPPEIESGGLEFFSPEQAKAITDYLHSSLYQHYKLYEFMFQCPQFEEIVACDLSVEVPPAASAPFPPPLDEGISESTYRDFLSIPTPELSQTEHAGTHEEGKSMSPVQVELPAEAEDIFKKLSPEDVRSIIQEVSTDVLNNLQSGVENKLKSYENNLLSRINKIHVVLPERDESEEGHK